MYIYMHVLCIYILLYYFILYYIVLYYIILYYIIIYFIIYIFDIICIMCIHISAWHHSSVFPECVARVPVSLCRSGGWGCVRSTLRLCSQPFATVPNRPQPSVQAPYGRAFGKFCKRGHFGRLHMSRCFVSHGRRGTSWRSDVFCNAWKVVLCGRHSTFATFSEDALQFSWQAQHFGRVHGHFA